MTDPESSPSSLQVDIVIFGGGIAGLWLLNHLLEEGYNVILLEAEALGNGQSIASQGIIHGGLKYALDGSISSATQAIAEMPAVWRQCLAGKGKVDLQQCKLLSDNYHMWSDGSVRSRLKTFLGSKTLRGKIELLSKSQYPAFFTDSNRQGSLYKLSDFVVDTASLLTVLASKHKDRIFHIKPSAIELAFNQQSNAFALHLKVSDTIIVLNPQKILFAAGEGNALLMDKAGLNSPQMQLRPLHMVLVRKAGLPLVFVHCIGDSFSLTPVLTLTSHSCADGEVVWYLGGEIAESGVQRTADEQILKAKALLHGLFPWVNLSEARWACLKINRAEGKADYQHRPDTVFLQNESNIMVTWPTKFTLSPALAINVVNELLKQRIVPRYPVLPELLTTGFQTAQIATPPWETQFG